ncbi:MAG: triose-phosphate isomerase [Tissierellia bacterium]|nr:triose-phosphate isomerase [Tissierellia bacterium]
MRSILIAGNWKMNTHLKEARALGSGLAKIQVPQGMEVLLAPPFPYLYPVGEEIKGTSLLLAGQNMNPADEGAQTGEVSAGMLKDLGASHVILGHSECRARGESSELIGEKLAQALKHDLVPILCVGESLEERQADQTIQVIEDQLKLGLGDLTHAQGLDRVIIAYEPIWAIGTGQVASPQEAEEVARDIRAYLAKNYGQDLAEKIQILYGGSMKGENAYELLSQDNIDGGLIGGASLKLESFLEIIEEGEKLA